MLRGRSEAVPGCPIPQQVETSAPPKLLAFRKGHMTGIKTVKVSLLSRSHGKNRFLYFKVRSWILRGTPMASKSFLQYKNLLLPFAFDAGRLIPCGALFSLCLSRTHGVRRIGARETGREERSSESVC